MNKKGHRYTLQKIIMMKCCMSYIRPGQYTARGLHAVLRSFSYGPREHSRLEKMLQKPVLQIL